jgi:formate hydrogenlyase transcriptional activator
LVRHFVGLFTRRLGKPIDTIPARAMEALTEYDWPGNVRELEHLIERAVILTSGTELRVPLADLTPLPTRTAPTREVGHTERVTLRESERELILRALDACGWVVGGPDGAAVRLGLKRTTLLSRMKKLGVSRPHSPGVE